MINISKIRYCILFSLLIALIPYKTVAQNLNNTNQRKKVALVLSGGGAKGMAHIGALKVLEKSGIKFDYIVGTSMGSIIGALYSIGYSAEEMDSIVCAQRWKLLLTDIIRNKKKESYNYKSTVLLNKLLGNNDQDYNKLNKIQIGGLVKGENITALFSELTKEYPDSMDFNKLPIPFACVATDLIDYKEVDIHSGYLPLAMRASMSIPVAFKPLPIDGNLLADGGLMNNFPADIAKQMGADIIIGLSVQNKQKYTIEDFNSEMSVVNAIINHLCKNKYEENVAITDLMINIPVDQYTPSDFNKKDISDMITIGEKAAQDKWDSLIKLRKSIER